MANKELIEKKLEEARKLTEEGKFGESACVVLEASALGLEKMGEKERAREVIETIIKVKTCRARMLKSD